MSSPYILFLLIGCTIVSPCLLYSMIKKIHCGKNATFQCFLLSMSEIIKLLAFFEYL